RALPRARAGVAPQRGARHAVARGAPSMRRVRPAETIATPETAAPDPPPLRRQREFLKLWAGQTISVFGDQVTILALPLAAVLTLDASAFQMGIVAAVGCLPHLLFSLHAGMWLDRHGRRRQTMIAADY